MRLTLLAAACLLSAPVVVHAQATDAARRLAQDAIIVDTHIDAPGVLVDKWADLAGTHQDREFDYPKARAGGLDVAFMSIYTSPRQDADGSAWQAANAMIDGVEALVQRHPDKFAILTSPKDAERLQEGGRVLLLNPDSGKLEERKIKTGLANWEYTEVLEGLAAGDRIVTSLEKEGIKAGATVTPDDKTKTR